VIALKPEDGIPTIAPMVFDPTVFNVENLLEIPEKEEKEIVVTVSTASNTSITDWVQLQISEALRLPADIIELDVPFQEYGVDSILLADLVKQLEKQLGNNVSLSPSIILEHPTVGMLSEYFTENFSDILSEILNEDIVAETKTVETVSEAPTQGATQVIKVVEKSISHEPIAVIGMACHFPDANNIGEFWDNLVAGKDSIKDVPAERWDTNEFYAPEKTPGKSYIKWGGFLDSIEDFDPKYFKIPEALAVQTDPLERQWLEVSAEAIQDAGYQKKDLSGKQVGVYAGSRVGNFKQKLTNLHKDFIVGTGQNFITAHLAHIYNLKGPNLVVDTACSSSLTAIDLAVKDLRLGVTEMALAGGVDILLDEGHFVGMSTAEVLSKDGRTKAFDEKADGTGLGEGCGVIVLKKLSDAIANGDKIYCVIEGTSVNNDGSTMGITTPNPKAQQALIESAIENGNVDRSTISYVEAHGTGTLVGDPIELKGITAVLGKNNDQGIKCAVGSVKTNIGHLMSASGIAGVIKVAMSISAKQLPPTLNCDTPNPRFDFDNSPVYPIQELQDWDGVSGIRRAGISAFGLGGNNAHVILSNHGIPEQNSVNTPFNTTKVVIGPKKNRLQK
jgi:acyl transferase domain-containing protein/acyl carrier protein